MKVKELILKFVERIENEKMKKKIKILEKEVKDLKSKNQPKTFFEKEWEKTKRDAFEGNS
jgi:cell division protein FtsB